MATHSSILAWESHGQRSLAGYGPGGLVLGRWHRQQEQRCREGALSPLGHSRRSADGLRCGGGVAWPGRGRWWCCLSLRKQMWVGRRPRDAQVVVLVDKCGLSGEPRGRH